jgi:putative phosphoribosyl transferase
MSLRSGGWRSPGGWRSGCNEGSAMTATSFSRTISIPVSGFTLTGDLAIPRDARGVVLFAHGSGSSRSSPRNRRVAAALQQRGLATLLLDLLTLEEEEIDAVDARLRFDVDFLAERLLAATDWLREQPIGRTHDVGYFGASTGAAAALIAAARRPDVVRAIVSRGGRPDLAVGALADVRAPTLLIVGGADIHVIGLNRAAAAQLGGPCKLEIVPRASHLFEEPGTLDQVAQLAGEWFVSYLQPHHPDEAAVHPS